MVRYICYKCANLHKIIHFLVFLIKKQLNKKSKYSKEVAGKYTFCPKLLLQNYRLKVIILLKSSLRMPYRLFFFF